MLLCVRAWNELEGTRPVWGSNLGPIPYDAVERWSAVNGLDEEMFALLLHALSVADGDRSRRIEAKAAMDAATGGNRR